MSLIRKERGMDASKDNPRTASTSLFPNFVASERVAGVQSNAYDVAGLNGGDVNRLKRFIDDERVSPHPRSSCSKDIQPSWSNNSHTKRHVAGVDKMDTHARPPQTKKKCWGTGNQCPGSALSARLSNGRLPSCHK